MIGRPTRIEVRGLGLVLWELSPPGALGPPILCLHGWIDQAHAFAAAAAGQPGRWLALDQRGCGAADPLPPGSYPYLADMVADLDAVVEHIGEPVYLVGHSMGGTLALLYAAARPEKVLRLVVIEGLGSLPGSEPCQLPRLTAFLSGLRSPPAPMAVDSPEDAAARLRRRHPGLSEAHAAALAAQGTRQGPDGRWRWSFDPLHIVKGPYPPSEAHLQDFLRAIGCPTLLVWGSAGWYPAETINARAPLLEKAEQITLPGGHMLPYEAPAALGAAITNFVGRP